MVTYFYYARTLVFLIFWLNAHKMQSVERFCTGVHFVERKGESVVKANLYKFEKVMVHSSH